MSTAANGRFEIVRTKAGWHTRFRAANGKIVWWTETYTTRRAAKAAIESIVRPFYAWIEADYVCSLSSRNSWQKTNHPVTMILEVDERVKP